MYFNNRQMNVVHNWKSNGYEIDESKLEGSVKVYAIKDNHVVLLFVVTEEESKINYAERMKDNE